MRFRSSAFVDGEFVLYGNKRNIRLFEVNQLRYTDIAHSQMLNQPGLLTLVGRLHHLNRQFLIYVMNLPQPEGRFSQSNVTGFNRLLQLVRISHRPKPAATIVVGQMALKQKKKIVQKNPNKNK
jgi:hypothetical protein